MIYFYYTVIYIFWKSKMPTWIQVQTAESKERERKLKALMKATGLNKSALIRRLIDDADIESYRLANASHKVSVAPSSS